MEEALLWSLYAICITIKSKNKQKNRRLRWSREWLLKRREFSHVRLLRELEPDDWRNYLRMDTETYKNVLKYVTPYIKRQNTCMRKAISAHERLSATLRFLATGRSYKDLEFTTIMSKQSHQNIFKYAYTKQLVRYVLRKYTKSISNITEVCHNESTCRTNFHKMMPRSSNFRFIVQPYFDQARRTFCGSHAPFYLIGLV